MKRETKNVGDGGKFYRAPEPEGEVPAWILGGAALLILLVVVLVVGGGVVTAARILEEFL